MGTSTTSNMDLVLPNVTIDPEPGPAWAAEINEAFVQVDAHNHTTGLGVPVPTAGLNINADLSMNSNALKDATAVSFSANTPTTDYSLYLDSGNLKWKTPSGSAQITTGNAVYASGGISGLESPAAAAWSSVSGYTFFKDTTTSTLDQIKAKQLSLSDSGSITVKPPASGNISVTLPASLPAADSFVMINSSGEMNTGIKPDGSTIQASAGVLSVVASAMSTPSGSVTAYAGTSAPSGWLYCNGQAVSRTTYAGLYAVIGSQFGPGNGVTTFNVPDLRGYFIRGQDDGAGHDPDASTRVQGPNGGNTGDNVGTYQADSVAAHAHTSYSRREDSSGGPFGVCSTMSVAHYTYLSETTSSSGGNETRPRNIYMKYIIKT